MALNTQQNETLTDTGQQVRDLQDAINGAAGALRSMGESGRSVGDVREDLQSMRSATEELPAATEEAAQGMKQLQKNSEKAGAQLRTHFGAATIGALKGEIVGGMSAVAVLWEESMGALAMLFDTRYSIIFKGTQRELALEEKAQKKREKFNKNMIGFAKKGFSALAGLKEELVEAMSSGDWSGLFLSFIDVLADMAIQMGTYFILASLGFALLGDVSKAAAGAIGGAMVALGVAWKAGRAIAQAASAADAGAGSGTSASTAPSGYGASAPIAGDGQHQERTVVINIDASGSLDTADTIARRLDEVMRRGRALGYHYG